MPLHSGEKIPLQLKKKESISANAISGILLQNDGAKKNSVLPVHYNYRSLSTHYSVFEDLFPKSMCVM